MLSWLNKNLRAMELTCLVPEKLKILLLKISYQKKVVENLIETDEIGDERFGKRFRKQF